MVAPRGRGPHPGVVRPAWPLCQPQSDEQEINEFDADEWRDEPSQSVNQQIVTEQPCGTHRAIGHAVERQGHKGDDDERVENDCA